MFELGKGVIEPAKMEPRKLIRLGNSSFAVALPKDWIDKSGLKKGDEVFVERNSNGEIILSPQFKKINSDKSTIINTDNKDERKIKREFTSCYINGNSIFEFSGSLSREKIKIIKNIIKDYVSCEVIEEGSQKIVVKDFFNFDELNVNNFIKRIDNNIREMFEIIIDSLEKNKISKNESEELERIDRDINKFYFLNSRILTLGLDNPGMVNKLKMEAKDLFNNWWLSFHLEHTGDNLKAIAARMKNEEISNESKKLIIPILNKMKERYQESLKTFYARDKNKAYEIMESGKAMLISCEDLSKNKDVFIGIIGEKLKELNNSSYQIVKMVSNLGV